MQCLSALVVCVSLAATVAAAGLTRHGRTRLPEGAQDYPELWFTQTLDHFNPTNTQTWQQRYYANESFYKPGGPVFLMIGGEGPANSAWMQEGAWITYAEDVNAYLLYLEHRFYGKSHPTEDVSVENLEYLSSEQALADLAVFTVSMQESLDLKENKWIAFGGSYPGSLAAWYRLKYPHLVHGAVATSAPILAQVNFLEYLEVVRDSLATYGEVCNSEIKEAHRQLHTLLQDNTGWNSITEEFRLCTPLDGTNELDVANLFSLLTENVEGVVQYNKDNRAFEGAKDTNITIDTVCGMMTDQAIGDPIARYAAVNAMMLDVYEEECLDHTYDSMINELRATSWENNTSGGRTWTYQTCTEFGFYQSSDSLNQPFGNEFPIEFFTKQCEDIFGPGFTSSLIDSGVQRTNTVYGGYNLKVTRVVFPNGSIDPWHALGVTSDLSTDATAIFINGTAHCANMYPASPSDPPQLIEAREQIFQLINKWLQE
ncbi:putative serine protease K12H4.7 [Procambarus clarkii]|uniref:putative serine protease K12H4.7 n=1 Tax=Procambarus clarkii TaxID=6728 RepID=UPI001E677C1A|nr:putative serine protease K12H4.7 [Procambarus clarkii]